MKNPYRVFAVNKKDEKQGIIGPWFIANEEGSVTAEGICCKAHAQVMADALNKIRRGDSRF